MSSSPLRRTLNRRSKPSSGQFLELTNTGIHESERCTQGHLHLPTDERKQNQAQQFHLPIRRQGLAKLSNLSSSQVLHAHFLKSSLYSDVCLQTSLLDLYVKCDQLYIAHNVFVKMPQREVISWIAMLVRFSQLGFPDRTTYPSVFSQAC
ncbi:Pentatricopeptide repeat-containing protein At4g19191, mitochondrial [Linum perenne]